MRFYFFVSLLLITFHIAQPLAGEYPELFEIPYNIHDVTEFLDSEQNTIEVFQKNVSAVVHIIKLQKGEPVGSGSGFIWDSEGHIITNFHVVKEGDEFIISFYNNEVEYSAVVQGSVPEKDIAVLKLQEIPSTMTFVTIGNSEKLMIGQKALALGNPFGFSHSLSRGIISALGRKMKGIGGVTIKDMIQTDSSINPGNSGGPLLDSQGNVIGMNTMIVSKNGGSNGLGFAIPINTIKRAVPQIIEHGEVIRAGLGISIENSSQKELSVQEGVVVKFVNPKSPAYTSGLRGLTTDQNGKSSVNDVILSIDGLKVDNYDDIYHALDKKNVGDIVEVEVRRKLEVRLLNIQLIKL